LTLVSAPAGFGKTTCVVEGLQTVDRPVTWLSLDAADDDPRNFLYYLVSALQAVKASIGTGLGNFQAIETLPPALHIASILQRDILTCEKPFLLVLDDFHLIQNNFLMDVLENLISRQPPNLHLVVITREDPLLPLSRHRANNQITEIRADDLRFTRQETGAFFHEMMELPLSVDEVNSLEDRTEGWVAGLQLVGLSLRGQTEPGRIIHSLGGSKRFILSYLTEEVLNRQTEEIQSFLLRIAILERLNGDLCNALTGRIDGQALLQHLFSTNLFLVQLDDEQHWFRFHHLFAEFLRNQQNRLPPEEVASLHRRASQWYENNNMLQEAIQHALVVQDYARVMDLLEKSAPEMRLYGYARRLDDWLKLIPAEWHSRSPKTNLSFAWMYLLRGKYALVEEYLGITDSAISALENSDGHSSREAVKLRAEWSALQSNLLQSIKGKVDQARLMAEKALELCREEDSYIRGVAYLGLGSSYRQLGEFQKAMDAYQQSMYFSRLNGSMVSEILAASYLSMMGIQYGRLQFAARVASQVIERVEAIGDKQIPILGAIHSSLGSVYYEWNRLEDARRELEKCITLSTLSGHNATLIAGKAALCRIFLAEGDLQAAREVFREAADLIPFGVPQWYLPDLLYLQVDLALAENDDLSAEMLIHPYQRRLEDRPIHPDENVFLAALKLAIYRAQHTPAGERRSSADLASAMSLADSLMAETSAAQRNGFYLHACLLRAILHSLAGQSESAMDDLDRAVDLAEPEGYRQVFMEEQAVISPLLKRLVALKTGDPQKRAFIESLVNLCHPVNEAAQVVPYPSNLTQSVDERDVLTVREVEVLRLIAAGLTYEETAERLFISKNTVRFFVKEIYRKLGVDNRMNAVDYARQRGWLS